MAHPHHWLLKNYRQRILTYYTRILLLDPTYGRTMMESDVPQDRRVWLDWTWRRTDERIRTDAQKSQEHTNLVYTVTKRSDLMCASREKTLLGVDVMTKNELTTTICLKKFPATIKLSVTLSNLNRFTIILHCWKAYGIFYKLLHKTWEIKNNIFCRYSANME